jgi:hypothetical protein
MRRIVVGRVAVDSATLVFTDPANLDNEWVKASDVEPYALHCLGRDVESLVAALRGLDTTGEVVPMSGGHSYRVFPSAAHTALELRAEALKLQQARGWIGAVIPVCHDSLERVQHAMRDGIGGEIDFGHGNPGFMAAVSLPADGIYEIQVDVEDTPAGAELKSIIIAVA